VEGGGWRVEGGGWRVEGGGWRVEGHTDARHCSTEALQSSNAYSASAEPCLHCGITNHNLHCNISYHMICTFPIIIYIVLSHTT
jgi:hypothetical protein